MKRFTFLACAGFLAAAMAAPSLAADLPRPAYKAPVYVAPFSWTGFYVGINGGYGWGTSDWTFTGTGVSTGNFDIKGGLVGGTLGYNLQTGNWVWGIEGDFDASWIKGTDTTTCVAPGCETRNRWLATLRGRVGYAFDHWLPYITGGGAFGDVKMTTPAATSETDTQAGWTAGAGVEWAFLGNWSAKLEYLYVDLGKANCSAATCGVSTDVDFKTNVVRAGVNYRF
ncbi:MAG TPA: outer membrane protein [Pseudolabrys sp.]|jgi:outer membrane immunogenic protein|nr:outer membrane protein [Pseudolabrys sp.]